MPLQSLKYYSLRLYQLLYFLSILAMSLICHV